MHTTEYCLNAYVYQIFSSFWVQLNCLWLC